MKTKAHFFPNLNMSTILVRPWPPLRVCVRVRVQ